jgi:ATP-dependent DNA ligase
MAGLWTYEAKIDGYRCLAAKRSSGVVLWSRRGNGFTVRFPEIARGCEKLPTDTLIDGEVVAIGEDGRPSFNALQHSRSNAYLPMPYSIAALTPTFSSTRSMCSYTGAAT